jgi:hypothetical protein
MVSTAAPLTNRPESCGVWPKMGSMRLRLWSRVEGFPMLPRLTWLARVAMLPLLFGIVHSAYANTAPTISKLRLVQKPNGITVKIFGAHFGTSPVKLPCKNCNITELKLYFFVGNPQGPQVLDIKQWTDSYIEMTGLVGTPGNTAVIAIKNDSLGKAGKTVDATVNLPGGPTGPKIRRVSFRREHKRLKVIVEGRGFGVAPAGIPGNIDTTYFQLWIWVTGGGESNYPWSAGHYGNGVTMNYESWTDSRIVISGFGSYYHDGGEGWVARPGDAVAVTLSNNPGGGDVGPSTGKASRLPW